VFGIDWPTIDSDIGLVPSTLDLLLTCIVAGLAQRLQVTQDEGVPIPSVWGDMVGDGGRGDDVAL